MAANAFAARKTNAPHFNGQEQQTYFEQKLRGLDNPEAVKGLRDILDLQEKEKPEDKKPGKPAPHILLAMQLGKKFPEIRWFGQQVAILVNQRDKNRLTNSHKDDTIITAIDSTKKQEPAEIKAKAAEYLGDFRKALDVVLG